MHVETFSLSPGDDYGTNDDGIRAPCDRVQPGKWVHGGQTWTAPVALAGAQGVGAAIHFGGYARFPDSQGRRSHVRQRANGNSSDLDIERQLANGNTADLDRLATPGVRETPAGGLSPGHQGDD